MDPKKIHKMEAQQLSLATLPEAIIETILCLLPIDEAARTSILSKEWRYKWTTIPKLVFVEDTVKRSTVPKKTTRKERPSSVASARKNMDMRCKLFYAIQQVLLLRQGPIHEFFLKMNADHTCSEIDQIILHLSRNHAVKKLTLDLTVYNFYTIPLSVFSLHHLTELYICSCILPRKPIFNGISSLTTLTLMYVTIPATTLMHLLSDCPSLRRLRLYIFEEELVGMEVAHLMDLFKCFHVIEHLTICGYVFLAFSIDSLAEKPPASLIHLKYICIDYMCFVDGVGLLCLAALFRCSPNIEKIKLEIRGYEEGDEIEPDELEEQSLILAKYSDVWLEHLYELEIKEFGNYKPELEFVKFILARSPNMKKVVLRICMTKDEELQMLKILLGCPHESQVEIIVDNRHTG